MAIVKPVIRPPSKPRSKLISFLGTFEKSLLTLVVCLVTFLIVGLIWFPRTSTYPTPLHKEGTKTINKVIIVDGCEYVHKLNCNNHER